MSIAPVKCSVDVKASMARAFELFATNMGAWWPRGKTPARSPHAALVIEPRKNGRWFELMLTAMRRCGARYLPGSRRVACCSAGSSTTVLTSTATY